MEKNLSIKIDLHELNDKIQYDGGVYLIASLFIDKKDYSRAKLIYFFVKVASDLANKLGMEDTEITEISDLSNK